MPQVLTLDGIEAELYPERAEFARRRGSKNRMRFETKKQRTARRRKGLAAIGAGIGATAALGVGGGLLQRRLAKKAGNLPMLMAAGSNTSRTARGGALTKTNIRGYDAGSGGLAGRRKLSLGDRAANAGRSARRQGRRAKNAVSNAVSRGKQRMASKSYR